MLTQTIPIADLVPTQVTVGMREVDFKPADPVDPSLDLPQMNSRCAIVVNDSTALIREEVRATLSALRLALKQID